MPDTAKLVKSIMPPRRFWKIVEKGTTLFDSVGYAELSTSDIIRFVSTYVKGYYEMIHVRDLLEELCLEYNTDILNPETKADTDSSVERFIHGMFYELGRQGIRDIASGKKRVTDFIESKQDIVKIINKYSNGDIWDIASAYAFQKVEEEHESVEVSDVGFEDKFKEYIEEFFTILGKDLDKEESKG